MSFNSTIVLNAVGDIALNNRFIHIIENGRGGSIFENIKHYFDNADINFANLESTLSNRGKRDKKNQLVWGSSISAGVLKSAGFDVLNLANNHICDYGFEGCIDTVKYLRDNNINCFGVGENLKESRKALVIKHNGITVGFIGYLCKTANGKYSSKNSYGSPPLKYSYVKRDLEKLSKKVDIKIVSLHWGFEQYHYPSLKQINLAHKIIEAGADLIIGHHPHVIQGYEVYKGKPIFYSLGNFIFDDIVCQNGGCLKWRQENNQSIIAKINISKNELSIFELTPVRSSDKLQIEIISGYEREVLLKGINYWSKAINRNGYGKFWKDFRIEKELRRQKPKIEYKHILKNVYKIRLRHLIYLLGELKKLKKFVTKYLLIKCGFNPSQYH